MSYNSKICTNRLGAPPRGVPPLALVETWQDHAGEREVARNSAPGAADYRDARQRAAQRELEQWHRHPPQHKHPTSHCHCSDAVATAAAADPPDKNLELP